MDFLSVHIKIIYASGIFSQPNNNKKLHKASHSNEFDLI